MSFGSTVSLPKTLQCWLANGSQQQMMCCTVSVSTPQNLQIGSPSNRPIVFSPSSPIFFPLEARIGCYMQVPISRSFKTGPSIYFRDLPCLCSHLQLWFLLDDGFQGGFLHHVGEILSDISDKLAVTFFRVTLNLPLLTQKPYSSVVTLLTHFSLVGGFKRTILSPTFSHHCLNAIPFPCPPVYSCVFSICM